MGALGCLNGTPDTVHIYLKINDAFIVSSVRQNREGIYLVSHVPVTHGVGSLTTGDSYTDLRNILNNGFRSDGSAPNAIVGLNMTNKNNLYSEPSMKDRTFGDKYVLEIYKANFPQDYDFEPESCELFHTTITKAETKDMRVMVFLDETIDGATKIKRKAFYKKNLGRFGVPLVFM